AVFDDPDALDFAAHEIARLLKSLRIHEVGNAGRGPCRNYIARKERHRTASGAQEYRASGDFESWRGLTRVNRGGSWLDLPPPTIDWMFSFCSHGAQECPT